MSKSKSKPRERATYTSLNGSLKLTYGAAEPPGSGEANRGTSTFVNLQGDQGQGQGEVDVEHAEVSLSIALCAGPNFLFIVQLVCFLAELAAN